MLERRYQSDLNYIKAHHRELIQAAQQEKLLGQTKASDPNLKERLLDAAGNRLIAWGQKLKGETYSNELSQECV
ncbi:MAG TPA: hypothetical protein VIS10_16840 [Anaerolineales bacterium]